MRTKTIPIAIAAGVIASGFCVERAWAQKTPLLPEKDVAALANELSGETAKRNLEVIATFHRQRGSKGFHAAAELVAQRLREYGLSDVAILEFPADGKIFYGTQRSRPAWDAEVGELEVTEVQRIVPCSSAKSRFIADCANGPTILHESYSAEPVVLAEDSETADVVTTIMDVGEGTKESDYERKDVKGKVVLASASPGAVQDLAVGKYGAVGIISYAQNQKNAWWGEDENLIRWGHLETFSPNKTFAFMVSLKTARELRERLVKGPGMFLHAVVNAGQHPGNYEVVTATIPGSDPKLKEEEIAFSCHLDHQRPGANDNASGCVTILEVARTLRKLTADRTTGGCGAPIGKIDDPKMDAATREEFEKVQICEWFTGGGVLPKPSRTIRFIFPPEIEGTLALLNSDYDSVYPLKLQKDLTRKSENGETYIDLTDHKGGTAFFPFYKHIKAVVHMDMVGGGPATKAVFHVTRGPMSLPSFVHDVAWAFAEWVNEESYKYAATGKADYPMVAPEGGKEPLRAEYSAYTMGSDHDVYQDSSFGVPAIYLNDWPDRYIHTNFDTAANIDPTKLKRAAFIGAASGYFLATSTGKLSSALGDELRVAGIDRDRQNWRRGDSLSDEELQNLTRQGLDYTSNVAHSTRRLLLGATEEEAGFLSEFLTTYPWRQEKEAMESKPNATGEGLLRFGRKREPKGPLAVFGYDYFADHAKAAGVAEPKLLSYEGLWGSGEEYAYEVLNFADGKRNAQEIRDAVSAEYGPVPLEMVVEYLKALEKIGLVAEVK